MSKNNTLIRLGSAVCILAFLTISVSTYGDEGGRTGRTRKTSTSGCSCHGSAVSGVTLSNQRTSSVVKGQTAQFSLVITRSGLTGAGLDVATRRGTLAAVTSGTRLQSGEITHNNNLPMTAGSITILFNYTAPATAGVDTLWADGLASNSDGNESGDQWNWAVNRNVNIIEPSSTLNLTALIEGLYNPGTNTLVSDTATIYLRNTTSPYAIVSSSKAILNSSGVGAFTFTGVSNGVPYYIVLTHRNAIETWSAAGNSFTANSMDLQLYNIIVTSLRKQSSIIGNKMDSFQWRCKSGRGYRWNRCRFDR
ncbi:MAG: hypothetical protein IPG02_17450 [Ignavibacteria bacterium]|nr:hypothetical protein [Ignavibacteria bacterium]